MRHQSPFRVLPPWYHTSGPFVHSMCETLSPSLTIDAPTMTSVAHGRAANMATPVTEAASCARCWVSTGGKWVQDGVFYGGEMGEKVMKMEKIHGKKGGKRKEEEELEEVEDMEEMDE